MARRAAVCTAPTPTAAPHLRRVRLAPAAPWPVGLSTARWIAVTALTSSISDAIISCGVGQGCGAAETVQGDEDHGPVASATNLVGQSTQHSANDRVDRRRDHHGTSSPLRRGPGRAFHQRVGHKMRIKKPLGK